MQRKQEEGWAEVKKATIPQQILETDDVDITSSHHVRRDYG